MPHIKDIGALFVPMANILCVSEHRRAELAAP
jgi:hypothetical protein